MVQLNCYCRQRLAMAHRIVQRLLLSTNYNRCIILLATACILNGSIKLLLSTKISHGTHNNTAIIICRQWQSLYYSVCNGLSYVMSIKLLLSTKISHGTQNNTAITIIDK